MNSNYPIIRLVSIGGHVFYARTTNWSKIAVGAGNETVDVSGAGISSFSHRHRHHGDRGERRLIQAAGSSFNVGALSDAGILFTDAPWTPHGEPRNRRAKSSTVRMSQRVERCE
jgi:hypothetical protein